MENQLIPVSLVTVIIPIVGACCGIILWAFSTFETKEDCKNKFEDVDSALKDNKISTDHIYNELRKIEQDVSFIRGKMSGS